MRMTSTGSQPRFGLVFTDKAKALQYDDSPSAFWWYSAEQQQQIKRHPQIKDSLFKIEYYVVNGPNDTDKDDYQRSFTAFEQRRDATPRDSGLPLQGRRKHTVFKPFHRFLQALSEKAK